MATEMRDLRETVQRLVREKNIPSLSLLKLTTCFLSVPTFYEAAPASSIVNMDETSMAIFALMVKTLHWMACKRVLGSNLGKFPSRFYISMPTLWQADGKVDFCVVWYAKRKNEKEHPGPRWKKIKKVWWYRSPFSKWATKRGYPEIIRFFIRLKDLLYFDDKCTAHDGNGPDWQLATVGACRYRIPPNCTAYGQPADRPTTNKKLKALTGWEMHIRRVRSRLRGEFRKLPESLNLKAKELISEVLATVRDKFNHGRNRKGEKHSAGIAQAFQETLLGEPHSELAGLLQYADPEPEPEEEPGEVECPYGCGETWGSETRAYKNHRDVCWFGRTKCYEPLQRGLAW